MEDISLKSWVFPTLPGTNPLLNWPAALPELNKRLKELKPLELWGEPFDEAYTFQTGAYQYIQQTLKTLKGASSNLKQTTDDLCLALTTTLLLTLKSGSYDRLVK